MLKTLEASKNDYTPTPASSQDLRVCCKTECDARPSVTQHLLGKSRHYILGQVKTVHPYPTPREYTTHLCINNTQHQDRITPQVLQGLWLQVGASGSRPPTSGTTPRPPTPYPCPPCPYPCPLGLQLHTQLHHVHHVHTRVDSQAYTHLYRQVDRHALAIVHYQCTCMLLLSSAVACSLTRWWSVMAARPHTQTCTRCMREIPYGCGRKNAYGCEGRATCGIRQVSRV